MKSDKQSIYSKLSNGKIYSPFSFSIDPMERLIFIDIKNDSDKIYNGFELQVFYDNNIGERILVRAERTDGLYDLYYQPGINFDVEKDIMSDRIVELIERPMENAKYVVTSKGVDVCFCFEDKYGRIIEGMLKEKNKKQKKPFSILAPVGGTFDKPPVFPLYLLFDMYFPVKNKTLISLNIDGITHKADTFPIPLNWSMCYFSRYSKDTFIVNWNKKFKGELLPLITNNSNQVIADNTVYDLVENDGHFEIKSMSTNNKRHQIKIDFTPAIPDIVCIKDEIKICGDFTMISDNSVGIISGTYYIQRNSKEIIIEISPSNGWIPNENKWELKFLYFVDPLFKKWPSTYIWNGSIILAEDQNPIMDAKWKRTENWKKTLSSMFSKLANINS